MKKLLHLSLALAITLITASPSMASAMAVPHLVISELQTATSASASQEFIELYNPTGASLSLTGWTIEYKSAAAADTAANWSKRATLTGTIAANGFFLVAPKSYIPSADIDWSATLAGSAGTIRIKDGTGTVIDTLGYGITAVGAEGMPAAAPAAGQSIERLPGRLNELAGNGTDTDSNSDNFIVRIQPNPQSTTSALEISDTTAIDDDTVIAPTDDPVVPGDSSEAPIPSSYAPIEITELLPNPMAPQTDANDEYVELYNPTSDPVDLAGYTLRTGSNFHDYYVMPSTVIAPGAYVVVYAGQTKLAMPNAGGAVELLDPSGAIADQAPSYADAPDGQAWAYFDSGWAWTLQLTPGQPNVLASLAPLPATVKATKPKTAAKKTAPAAKKAKAAVKKATKKRKPAKPKKLPSPLPRLVAERDLQPASWLIIILAALTIGYAIYEFRHDIYNLYHRLRSHSPAGSDHRPVAPGRGDD